MIDVIFLLLTFFIYAMVLMVRAYLLPIELPGISGAVGAPSGIPAISISIDADGLLYVDTEPYPDIEAVIKQIQAVRADDPKTRIYVAAALEGTTDRLPAFIDLMSELRMSGIDQFFVVGNPIERNNHH